MSEIVLDSFLERRWAHSYSAGHAPERIGHVCGSHRLVMVRDNLRQELVNMVPDFPAQPYLSTIMGSNLRISASVSLIFALLLTMLSCIFAPAIARFIHALLPVFCSILSSRLAVVFRFDPIIHAIMTETLALCYIYNDICLGFLMKSSAYFGVPSFNHSWINFLIYHR